MNKNRSKVATFKVVRVEGGRKNYFETPQYSSEPRHKLQQLFKAMTEVVE